MGNWVVETIKDAYKERPPVRYAVNGLIQMPSLNVLYGAPSTLKSMLLLDLAMSIVKGEGWLKDAAGIPKKVTVKSGVLWVDFDNGRRRTQDRVKAVGSYYGTTTDDAFYYVSMPHGGLDMGDLSSVKDLEDAITERLPTGGVAVIDNLGCVIGAAEENSHGMARIMSNFRTLAERHQVAFILVHHQRKSNGVGGRVGDSLRGHSSIEAALDLALLIEREGQSNHVDVRSTKSRGIEVTPFGAEFRFQGSEGELERAWFVGIESNGIESRTDKAIQALLAQGPRNKSQIEKHCKDETGASATKVSESLARLIKAGLVDERPGHRKELRYSLKIVA